MLIFRIDPDKSNCGNDFFLLDDNHYCYHVGWLNPGEYIVTLCDKGTFQRFSEKMYSCSAVELKNVTGHHPLSIFGRYCGDERHKLQNLMNPYSCDCFEEYDRVC